MSSVPIQQALDALRSGNFLIVTDDADRENEGDLIMAAEAVTPEKIAFMIEHTGGVLCLALSNAIADQLDLPPMTEKNTAKRQTAFTVSIEAKDGVTTGISAADRAHTIRTAMNPVAQPTDLARPGHVFPLRAKEGGVLTRAGHTEAGTDLCRLAGLREGAVISELMQRDGTMMRSDSLKEFADKFNIPIITIADLIAYRHQKEVFVRLEAESSLKTAYGTWSMRVYRDTRNSDEHVALTMGTVRADSPILTRVHSECLTGDTFHSLHCDCGAQLACAMEKIEKEGTGIILYMRQEGRGIGLANKVKAYALQQEKGLYTVEANEALGLGADLRDYGIGAQILKDLGACKLRLLTNNPQKIVGLTGFGLEVIERVPIVPPMISLHQEKYLDSKQQKMGHLLRPKD